LEQHAVSAPIGQPMTQPIAASELLESIELLKLVELLDLARPG
jgi:hypothetical protein